MLLARKLHAPGLGPTHRPGWQHRGPPALQARIASDKQLVAQADAHTATTAASRAAPLKHAPPAATHAPQPHLATPASPSHLPQPPPAHAPTHAPAHTPATHNPATATDWDALMFDDALVQPWSPALRAWLPLGALLAGLRMGLWVAGIALDAPWFRQRAVVDAYLALLGVKVTWHNQHLIPSGYHVMVSNHTTAGDLMALFTLPTRYVHLITTALPQRVLATKNLPVVLKPAALDTYDELARTAADPGAAPVHLFPEGGMTNGSAMLQFSRGFTKLAPPGTPVVPVALRAALPAGVRAHTLTSSFLANLAALSACPRVALDAVVLAPMVQGPGEARGAFVKRVQLAIAEQLGCPISDITIQQKRQMMQRRMAKKRQ